MKDPLIGYQEFNQNNLNKILKKYGDPKKLKILYLSCYNPNYTRTETLINLFKKNNINYKAVLTGNSKLKYLRLLFNQLKEQKKYDIIFVGFRGQEILPFIKLIARKPIIFDAFVSAYDTLCLDRKLFAPTSLIGRFIKQFDKYTCKISDTILVDTKTHSNFFKKEFKCSNADYLYVGANLDLFKEEKIKNKKYTVFWYGNCLPLQGADIILKTAKLLESELKIEFKIVGPVQKKYNNLIKKLNLKNVKFENYIAYKKLPKEINKSSLCLGGHFSNIPKAKRVIAGKTFQFLSCNKPTIVGDCESNRELFDENTKNIYFVEMGDEKNLAKKIMEILK